MFFLSASYLLFVTTLIFSPLAFGATELWSITIVQILVFLSLCSYFLALYSNKQIQWYKPPGLSFLLLFCGYILFQLVPLPPGVLKTITPRASEIYQQTSWIISPGSWLPITVVPKATLSEFFKYSTTAALYILTVQLLSKRDYLRKTIVIVIALSGLIALAAILQKFSSPHKIYWLREITGGTPVGPWVNRNHYAGFMEMIFPVTLALFLYYKPKIRYKTSLRKRLTLLIALPESNAHMLFGLAGILIGLSIFLSFSRGGIISLCLSLCIFIVLISIKKIRIGQIKVVPFLFLLVILSVSWFGWQPIWERFGDTLDEQGEITNTRFDVWEDSYSILKDFPLTGSGAGSYIDVYRAYRTVPGRAIFDHAHNDYLELLCDTGIIGSILSVFFLITLFRFGFSCLKKRRDKYALLLFSGSFIGVISLMFHSSADFNLHILSNALYFFFWCGLMTVAISQGGSRSKRIYLATTRSGKVLLMGIPAFCLLAASILFHFGQLNSQYHYFDLQKKIIYKGMHPDRLGYLQGKIEKVISNDPLEPSYREAKGNILYLAEIDLNGAKTAYQEAVRLNPLRCSSLQNLGRVLAKDNFDTAAALFETATIFNPIREDCSIGYASWLFSLSKREQALEVINQTLTRSAVDSHHFFSLMKKNNLMVAEITSLLPKTTFSYLQYAQFLWKDNQFEKALEVFEEGMLYLDEDTLIQPRQLTMGYHWFKKQRHDSKAFALMQQAIQKFPNYPLFHEKLGDHYRREGILYRAKEEYGQALTLEPDNRRVRKKIAKME